MSAEDIKHTKQCPHCEGTGRVGDDYAIGQMIRKLRLDGDWTLRGLARAMEISAPYLSDLEHGRRRWRPELIERAESAMTTNPTAGEP